MVHEEEGEVVDSEIVGHKTSEGLLRGWLRYVEGLRDEEESGSHL
jgi:hypothetical protein